MMISDFISRFSGETMNRKFMMIFQVWIDKFNWKIVMWIYFYYSIVNKTTTKTVNCKITYKKDEIIYYFEVVKQNFNSLQKKSS